MSWAFGIVRANELQDGGRTLFDELCERASEIAGIRFEPLVATSYRELAQAIERAEVGVAWLPPIPTIELESTKATVLAIPARNGTTTYHAAFVVRRGGPKRLDELKGRRAAWVQRDSSSGYLVPRMHLAAQGFDVLHFFSRELFVHSHTNVVDAVVNGEADVGATYCHVDAASGKIVRSAWVDEAARVVRPVDVLATFGPIPNDAVVASNELEAPARSALARWLLALDDRSRELFDRLLGANDFRVPAHDHYGALRHAIRAARARGHDSLPPESRRGIRSAKRS